ncbi:abietadienol/abietadienal oxidase, partial [Tanacetum coccineum]
SVIKTLVPVDLGDIGAFTAKNSREESTGVEGRLVDKYDLTKLAINLMVNQLLGISSENEVGEIAQLFSDFVDGCLSVPVSLPGFAYHNAMNARKNIIGKINKIIADTRHGDTSGGGLVRRLVEEGSLQDDAIADFVINLLFAGNETTAKTMLFAIYFLTNSPEAADQLLVLDPLNMTYLSYLKIDRSKT